MENGVPSIGVLSVAGVGDYNSGQAAPFAGPLRMNGNALTNVGAAIENSSGPLALLPASGSDLVLSSEEGVLIFGGLALGGHRVLDVAQLDSAGLGLTTTPAAGGNLSLNLVGVGNTLTLEGGVSLDGLGGVSGVGVVSNAAGSVAFRAGGGGALTLDASGGHTVQLATGSAHSMNVSRPTPTGEPSPAQGVLSLMQGIVAPVGFVFHPQSGGDFNNQGEPLQNTAGVYHKSTTVEMPRCLVQIDAATSAEHGRTEGANLRLFSAGTEVLRVEDQRVVLNAPLNMSGLWVRNLGMPVGDSDAIPRGYWKDLYLYAKSAAGLVATGTITPLQIENATPGSTWGLLSSGQIQVPQNGRYAVTVFLTGTVSGSDACQEITLQLKNGNSVLIWATDSVKGEGQGASISMVGHNILELAVGQVYTLYYTVNGASLSYQAFVLFRSLHV